MSSAVAAGDSVTSQSRSAWRTAAITASMRAGCSGCGPVSCSSDEGWWRKTGRPTRGYRIPTIGAVDHSSTRADLVVVGAGAAGLYCALCAAREGARVVLVSATPLAESSSYWAQGGLAAALAPEDSPQRHREDTLRAGRGAVRPSAADVLAREAPAVVHDLEALGVAFDADRHGTLALGLEGGHTVRRIAHAGGAATGRRITRQLSADVAEHDGVEVWEQTRATALIADAERRVVGVRCDGGREIRARGTVLATGGAAALWARTTNPLGATGKGLSLAYAAGAALADLELLQFHPTAVRAAAGRPGHAADGFLVTEAIRGEGATLTTVEGERFVDELAPRDEVAIAIRNELARSGDDAVLLDLRGIDASRFPNVFARLTDAGLDPSRDPVPVSPAAHYMMGGIATDDRGAASLPGLLAIGECACTGLHGANRLASNSLSECCVYGARAAHAALDAALPPAGAGRPVDVDPAAAGDPRAVHPRGAVARRGPRARRRRDDPPARGPAPARPTGRRLRPGPPREPRRAPPPRRPGDRPGARLATRRRARRRRARPRALGLDDRSRGRRGRMCAARGCRAATGGREQCLQHGPGPPGVARRRGARAADRVARGVDHPPQVFLRRGVMSQVGRPGGPSLQTQA